MEALKFFEARSDDVIFTIFSCLLDEESTAAVQKCVTAHNTAITPQKVNDGFSLLWRHRSRGCSMEEGRRIGVSIDFFHCRM